MGSFLGGAGHNGKDLVKLMTKKQQEEQFQELLDALGAAHRFERGARPLVGADDNPELQQLDEALNTARQRVNTDLSAENIRAFWAAQRKRDRLAKKISAGNRLLPEPLHRVYPAVIRTIRQSPATLKSCDERTQTLLRRLLRAEERFQCATDQWETAHRAVEKALDQRDFHLARPKRLSAWDRLLEIGGHLKNAQAELAAKGDALNALSTRLEKSRTALLNHVARREGVLR